jgi:hypothetical protein
MSVKPTGSHFYLQSIHVKRKGPTRSIPACWPDPDLYSQEVDLHSVLQLHEHDPFLSNGKQQYEPNHLQK